MSVKRTLAPLLGLATLAALTLAAAPARAAVTFYTTQSAFQSAAGSLSPSYNFDAYVAPPNNSGPFRSFAFSPGGPTGTPTVTFTEIGTANLYLDGTGYGGYADGFGGSSVIDTNTKGDALGITGPAGTKAFGANFGANGSSGAVFTFTITDASGTTTQSFAAPVTRLAGTGAAFFGFTDSSPITGFTVTPTANDDVITSNFQYGSGAPATSTPEPPATAAFAFTALGALGLMWKARKRAA